MQSKIFTKTINLSRKKRFRDDTPFFLGVFLLYLYTHWLFYSTSMHIDFVSHNETHLYYVVILLFYDVVAILYI